jgi:hypothetical protein
MRRVSAGSALIAAVGLAAAALVLTIRPGSAEPSAPYSIASGAISAKLPLAFEPNRGQADSRVSFLARGAGYSISLLDRPSPMFIDELTRPAFGR